MPAPEHAQCLERWHAVERAEVRHDRVKAFRAIERIEILRQMLQPTRQQSDPIAEACSSEAAPRPRQHFCRWVARHHARTEAGEEQRIESRAAADFEHAEA